MRNESHQGSASSQAGKQPSSTDYESAKNKVKEYCDTWHSHFFAKRQQFRRMKLQERNWEITMVKTMEYAFSEQTKLKGLVAKLEYENNLVHQLSGQQVTCGKVCRSQWRKLKLCDSHAILLMIVGALVSLFLILYLVNGGTATFDLFAPQGPGNRVASTTAENGIGGNTAGDGNGGTTAADTTGTTARDRNGGTAENTTRTIAGNSTGTTGGNGSLACDLGDKLSLVKVASTGSLQASVDCSASSEGWIRIVVATKNISERTRDLVFSLTSLITAFMVVFLYFCGPFLFTMVEDCCSWICGKSKRSLKESLDVIIAAGQSQDQEMPSANGMLNEPTV